MDLAYPGDAASVHDIIELAGHYRTAAMLLGEHSPRGKQIAHTPRRFLALHSIELYLNDVHLRSGRSFVDLAYPGDAASVHDIIELAGSQIAHTPRRFLALHSIELYLNAFLLAHGHDPKTVRGQHDIGERARRAIADGLILRKRTAEHLETLSSNREYLVTRYGPEMTTTLSQVNRVMATLEELSLKVGKIVDGQAASLQPRVSPRGG
ncbi:hypothetical protein [Sinorhizobium fredii]